MKIDFKVNVLFSISKLIVQKNLLKLLKCLYFKDKSYSKINRKNSLAAISVEQ